MGTEKDWKTKYNRMGALWIHDGKIKRPHVILASRRHSNGYFNSRLVTQDEPLLRQAVQSLVLDHFIPEVENTNDLSLVDRVVGPQTGATELAEFISDEIGYLRGDPCNWASPAKEGEGESRRMVFNNPARKVLPGETVLLCEDVIATGSSVDLTSIAAENAGGIVLPFILALVNRSGFSEFDDKLILALIDHHMPIWEPRECLLCHAGSEALDNPKDPENWQRLNADYD